MKTKDTLYLYSSARVRTLENNLLSRDSLDKLIDAPSFQDMAKLLSELGYHGLSEDPSQSLEKAISDERERIFSLMLKISPDPNIVRVFSLKYDYHNLKVLLKSTALGEGAGNLLLGSGEIPPSELESAVNNTDFSALDPIMREAAGQAYSALALSKDPQACDLALERAMYAQIHRVALESGSSFLYGYAALITDAANLRSAVRAQRQGQSSDFISTVFFTGGNISVKNLISAIGDGEALSNLFLGSFLEDAALTGASILSGEGSFAEFERNCDNAIIRYLLDARYIPFGDAPLIAFLGAKENEFVNLRIITSSKKGNLPSEKIRERLRFTYV